jgi:hypothetical protein
MSYQVLGDDGKERFSHKAHKHQGDREAQAEGGKGGKEESGKRQTTKER